MAERINRAYEANSLSERQQKNLNNARARAVHQAWRQEKVYVKDGMGTRDWTPQQQEDIVRNGSVHGFEGHHMRSVSYGQTYDEQMEIAGDKNNIQFLEKTKENNEHLRAHGGDTKNRTNGYYDVEKDETRSFEDRAPEAPKAEKLSNPVMQEEKIECQKTEKMDEYGIVRSENAEKQECSRDIDRER